VFLGIFVHPLLAVFCRLVDSQGEILPNFGGFGPSGTPGAPLSSINSLKTCKKLVISLNEGSQVFLKNIFVTSSIKSVGYTVPSLHSPLGDQCPFV
jgi:hypothetical protein